MDDNDNNNFDIIPSHLAIEKMRYSGYRNTAHALFEIVDNAIDADAKNIQIIFYNKADKNRGKLSQIAVLDDGVGMSKNILRHALQFAYGTRSKSNKIGRFGMGLPNSSISQCRKVDVWTWQKSLPPYHTYLSIDQIINNGQKQVPIPTEKPIPEELKQIYKNINKISGTLVLWSDLDQVSWETARATKKNSEELIGRIYRKFIKNNNLEIIFTTFDQQTNQIKSEKIQVNDPGYLMSPSTTPSPFDKKPMFVKFSEEKHMLSDKHGNKYPVKIICSLAPKATLEASDGDSGKASYGKHAKHNIGISLVRANRELILDQGMVRKDTTTERWWGIEICFEPELDDVFGVSYTKQHATHFTDSTTKFSKKLDDDEEEDDELNNSLMDMIEKRIYPSLRNMRGQYDKFQKGVRSTKKKRSPEDTGTIVVEVRKKTKLGESDEHENDPTDIRISDLANIFKTELPTENANDIAAGIVNDGKKFKIVKTKLSGDIFFDWQSAGGILVIKLNMNHPFYKNLVGILEGMSTNENEQLSCDEKLELSKNGLLLVFMAWARYEDEMVNDDTQRKLGKFRIELGEILHDFLDKNI